MSSLGYFLIGGSPYLLIALIMIGIQLGVARQNRKDAESDRNLPILTDPAPDSIGNVDFEVKHGQGMVILFLVPGVLFLLIGILFIYGSWSGGDGLFGNGGLGMTGLIFAVLGVICIDLVHYYRRFRLHVVGTTMLITPHFASARAIQPSEIGQLAYIASKYDGIHAKDTSGRGLFSVTVIDRNFGDLVLWLLRVRRDLFTPKLVAQLKVLSGIR